MWTDIINVVNKVRKAVPGINLGADSLINFYGKATETAFRGTLRQAELSDNKSYEEYLDKLSPMFNLTEPVWHSAIDKIFVLPATLDAQTAGLITPPRFLLAKCTLVDDSHGWAMVDPDRPTQLKSGTAGIFRMLSHMGDDLAVVDTAMAYYDWRFELSATLSSASGGGSASGQLLNWDGTVFAANCTLTDPDGAFDGMTSGDQGRCFQRGNDFIIQQAPC